MSEEDLSKNQGETMESKETETQKSKTQSTQEKTWTMDENQGKTSARDHNQGKMNQTQGKTLEEDDTQKTTWTLYHSQETTEATDYSQGKTWAMDHTQGHLTHTHSNTETQPTLQEKGKEKDGRKVFVMRHAERMDRVFPGWTRLAFTSHGKYRPYDLNQPLTLPNREGGAKEYLEDTPITEMGHGTAQLIGRAMSEKNLRFQAIYTSPALRCIQTGSGILKTLNTHLKMRVEPGLFEWLAWYQTPPRWLPPQELTQASYPVDPEYEPVMSVEEVMKNRSESILEHYWRLENVTKAILRKHESPEPILIIGHGTTVDAGARTLLGKETKYLPPEAQNMVGVYVPYCCVVGVEKKTEGEWDVIHDALPLISFSDATNRIDHHFFSRA